MSITSNLVYDMQREQVYTLPTEVSVRSRRRPITRINLFNEVSVRSRRRPITRIESAISTVQGTTNNVAP
jgi:hypothetical protein